MFVCIEHARKYIFEYKFGVDNRIRRIWARTVSVNERRNRRLIQIPSYKCLNIVNRCVEIAFAYICLERRHNKNDVMLWCVLENPCQID